MASKRALSSPDTEVSAAQRHVGNQNAMIAVVKSADMRIIRKMAIGKKQFPTTKLQFFHQNVATAARLTSVNRAAENKPLIISGRI